MGDTPYASIPSPSSASSQAPRKVAADQPSVLLRVADLKRQPFLIIRKLYGIYFSLLAGIFILVLGLNFMLQVLFSLFLPEVGSDRNLFAVALGLFALLLLMAFFLGSVVSHAVLFMREVWSDDQFLLYRIAVTFDTAFPERKAKSGNLRGLIDVTLQLIIVLSMECVPIVVFCVIGGVSGLGPAIEGFFLSAMLATTIHILLFWFFVLLNDYAFKAKALLNIWHKRGTGNLLVPKRHSKDEEIGEEKKKALLAAAAQNRVVMSFVHHLVRKQTPQDALNIWVLIFEFLEDAFRTKRGRLIMIVSLLAVLVVAVVGIFVGWMALAFVMMVILFVAFVALLFEATGYYARKAFEKHPDDPTGMAIFMRQHCGVNRRLILKFALLFLAATVLFTIVLLLETMWIVFAIAFLLILSVALLGFFAVHFPNALWVLVVAECGLFAVVSLVNNFAVFGEVVGGVTLILIIATQSFLTKKTRLTFPLTAVVMIVFMLLAGLVSVWVTMRVSSREAAQSTGIPFSSRSPLTTCSARLDGRI